MRLHSYSKSPFLYSSIDSTIAFTAEPNSSISEFTLILTSLYCPLYLSISILSSILPFFILSAIPSISKIRLLTVSATIPKLFESFPVSSLALLLTSTSKLPLAISSADLSKASIERDAFFEIIKPTNKAAIIPITTKITIIPLIKETILPTLFELFCWCSIAIFEITATYSSISLAHLLISISTSLSGISPFFMSS